LRCLLPDGTWTFLPEWMTSREQCARLVLADDPCVSVAALEALIGLLRALPQDAVAARIEAEAMSDDKEARHDATRESGQDQLELEWPSAMRWADVPVDIRDCVREHLGDLLQQVATPSLPVEESADE
jgi:hypothetical protein